MSQRDNSTRSAASQAFLKRSSSRVELLTPGALDIPSSLVRPVTCMFCSVIAWRLCPISVYGICTVSRRGWISGPCDDKPHTVLYPGRMKQNLVPTT